MLRKFIRFFIENQVVTAIFLLSVVGWGLVTSPFESQQLPWSFLPSDPVSIDAIPDLGENQQIIYSSWKGRSPQDIEDQITYPLTSSLLGIPGVKTIRSSSVFGFSSIYVIFNDDVDFYWSRSRILEKLSALPAGLLPEGVEPSLGPDATALGQVFWYTLEGRDADGNIVGGWDLHEIRKVQDFYVKNALDAVDGVSEVASIGGYQQEYQVDIDPDALRAYQLTLKDVIRAVKSANLDVGANTLEINRVEYLVRGLGSVTSLEDLEMAVIRDREDVPVLVRDVARVTLGPASRRGVLDKEGTEVVGGVVVARYGANPMQVISNVKEKIMEIQVGMPSRTLADGTVSRLTIVPFYDRTELIAETIDTLSEALSLEVLITVLVVIILLFNIRASIVISAMLPIAILMVFIFMKYLHIEANIVALSGIAIAIGTMVDLGIILTENIVRHLKTKTDGLTLKEKIFNASSEVAPAIITAVATTIVSFVPVFALQAAEGKLFVPLAFTKTFALLAALIVTLVVLPTVAGWLFGINLRGKVFRLILNSLLVLIGILTIVFHSIFIGALLMVIGLTLILPALLKRDKRYFRFMPPVLAVAGVIFILSEAWMPLGVEKSAFLNFIFASLLIAVIIGFYYLIMRYYTDILRWCLDHKLLFLAIPIMLLFLGINIWLGFERTFSFFPGVSSAEENAQNRFVELMTEVFPGTAREFMPVLDEGSFLLMPSNMPHVGVDQSRQSLQLMDRRLAGIPEVALAVGKLGRVESALDPAPVAMYETIINLRKEYLTDANGQRIRFKTDDEGNFFLSSGEKIDPDKLRLLKPETEDLRRDENGTFFRIWRDHIRSPEDIWDEIVAVTRIPGIASAPRLQPIETRLLMLQTGMRSPLGIKIKGPDQQTIQAFGFELELLLKNVRAVRESSVFADRIIGKPYIHLDIRRDQLARYGLSVSDVQAFIEPAIGGLQATTTIEGRERFAVRVRYPRELRDSPEDLRNLLLPISDKRQVKLGDLVDISYQKGPQMIRSEDTFLTGYVLFDKSVGYSESEVVEQTREYLNNKIASGKLVVPPGVSFKFAGTYESQERAEKRLALIIPVVLAIIFLILYWQFRSVATTLMIFAAVLIAFSGGFLLIWLFGMDGFLNFSVLGSNLREIFQMQTINLSVAVWVGFIALFGIATDDGVLIATRIDQQMKRDRPSTVPEMKAAVIRAGSARIRPAVMTTVTTLLALLPVLTSTGKGSEIMIPMAIPVFGGMLIASVTYFVVPVLYSARQERTIRKDNNENE